MSYNYTIQTVKSISQISYIVSVGSLAYQSSNNSLYFSETEAGIFQQIMQGKIDFDSEPWPSISESAKDLMLKMLERDPRRRITAHEVLCE